MIRVQKNNFFITWQIFGVLLVIFLFPSNGLALQVSYQHRGNLEELTLVFEGQNTTQYTIERVGKRELALYFQDDALAEVIEFPDKLLTQAEPVARGVIFRLSTDAFGYIASPPSEDNQCKLIFFEDSLGTRWKPNEARFNANDSNITDSNITGSNITGSEETLEQLVPEENKSIANPSSLPRSEAPFEESAVAPGTIPEALSGTQDRVKAVQSSSMNSVSIYLYDTPEHVIQLMPEKGVKRNTETSSVRVTIPQAQENIIETSTASPRVLSQRAEDEPMNAEKQISEQENLEPELSSVDDDEAFEGQAFESDLPSEGEEVSRPMVLLEEPTENSVTLEGDDVKSEEDTLALKDDDLESEENTLALEDNDLELEKNDLAADAIQIQDKRFITRVMRSMGDLASPPQGQEQFGKSTDVSSEAGDENFYSEEEAALLNDDSAEAQPVADAQLVDDAQPADGENLVEDDDFYSEEEAALLNDATDATQEQAIATAPEQDRAIEDLDADTQTIPNPSMPETSAENDAFPELEEQAEETLIMDENPDRFAGMSEEDIKGLQALDLILIKAQSLISSGDLKEAEADFKMLLQEPLLTDTMRVEILYDLGSLLMTLYRDSPQEHFSEISKCFTEAMNADLKSPQVPTALMSLGLINLWVNNLPEAKAYFDILASEYPYNEAIPSIGYYYGEYYYRKGEYEKAADFLQAFIETYPEQEELARQAAFLLTDALVKLHLFEQAYQIVDYVDKRWPQTYSEEPDFLKLAADIEYQLDKLHEAKKHYWIYYNVQPKDEACDMVLARIGDIFLRQGKTKAAKELYSRAATEFPDKEGGLISKMRLAEEGIYDKPTFMEMVTVFDRPYSLNPKKVYTEIIEKHPESRLASLALLKLGMWHFFQKEYAEALAAAQRLLEMFPDSPLVDRAQEVGNRSFALAVPQLLQDENYKLITDFWERYDFTNLAQGDEANSTRIGVAKSYAEQDAYKQALELLTPFLGEKQVEKYSEMALAIALDVFIEERAWSRIQEFAKQVEKNWNISDRTRRHLVHAEAIAFESLGQSAKAVRLWAQLGADENVEPEIRADAMFHLAQEAMDHQDLRRVFVYAQEALKKLLTIHGDTNRIMECLRMSIYATERSGRYQQALQWAQEYDKYIAQDNPEWAEARYRLARIYRKAGAEKEWQNILQGIRDNAPDSLYGKLAATALETDTLEEQVQEYVPGSS